MDLENIEQVEVPLPQMPIPPVEEVISQAGFGVQRFETPQGPLTVLQFVSPFKVYTFKLSDEGAEALADAVRPSRVVPATALDLSRLAP